MSEAGLEAHLRARRSEGRPLLVPYVTAGLGDDWPDVVRAVVAAGADAVEIGIPFSDPVMDGPTIQEASQRALGAGATPTGILAAAASLDVDVPLVVMTYYNVAHHAGHERFAAALAGAGVTGAILPDLPLDELIAGDGGPSWAEAADACGVATVLLAAPTTPEDRLRRICERSRGFVYGISLLGVTGRRERLAELALQTAARVKAATDLPALVGVGISTPEQAVEACTVADGVIIGSALVAEILEAHDAGADGPEAAHRFGAGVRAALDESSAPGQ